jgi:hypothetical protein
MELYIELWKAREAWLALAPQEREAFFGVVGQQIGEHLNVGCELVGVAAVDPDTPHRA